MMPNDWHDKKLKDIGIQVIDGDRGANYPKQGDFSSNGYCLFLSAKNVTKTGFKFEECQFISEEKHKQMRKGEVLKNDIVLTTRGTVGNMAYFSDSIPYSKMRINSGMVILRNGSQEIDTFFLYKALSSYIMEKQIASMSFGSAQPQLTVKIINDLSLPIPPKNEQGKIAEILSTWDEAIDKLEKILSIKNTEFTWLINMAIAESQGSPMMTIEELFEVGRGRVISKGEIQKNIGEYPVYSSQTSNDGIFGYLNTYDFEGEYLTWTTDGVHAGSIFYRNGKFNCTNVCGTLKQKYKDINLLFISYLLRNITPKYVSKNLANPKLMNGIMKAIKINVPPMAFQASTAKLFQTKKQEIDLLTKKVELLKLQKQGLMQQLLTGKKRVKV